MNERRTGENCQRTKLTFTSATKTSVSCKIKNLEAGEAAVCKNAGVTETVEYRLVSILLNSYTAF